MEDYKFCGQLRWGYANIPNDVEFHMKHSLLFNLDQLKSFKILYQRILLTLLNHVR